MIELIRRRKFGKVVKKGSVYTVLFPRSAPLPKESAKQLKKLPPTSVLPKALKPLITPNKRAPNNLITPKYLAVCMNR